MPLPPGANPFPASWALFIELLSAATEENDADAAALLSGEEAASTGLE